MKATLLALAIILNGSVPGRALDCIPPVGSSSEASKVTRSWFVRSPDKSAVAWSVVIQELELVSSRLVVRDKRTRVEQTVGATRWDKDRIVGLDASLSERGDNFHVFCPIDWSPDGQRLLLGETIGPMDSDAGGTTYWIYERASGQVRRVNLDGLHETTRIYWKMTDDEFGPELAVEGWRRGLRGKFFYLVVRAYGEPGDGRFLGWWEIREDGTQPRLIGEREAIFRVRRFGSRLGH